MRAFGARIWDVVTAGTAVMVPSCLENIAGGGVTA